MISAIISIKPYYVDKILSKDKTVEIRRTPVRFPTGTQLWLYATLPRASLVGVCTVKNIERGNPNDIWIKYSLQTGISSEDYIDYTYDSKAVTAITLDNVQKITSAISLKQIRKIIMNFQPPQFYSYIKNDSHLLKLLETSL